MDQEFLKIYERQIDEAVSRLTVFPWENKANYAAWLAQTWYFVRYSTRLLALAAGGCSINEDELHKRYLSHLKEETGHEKLAFEDMKHLGYSPIDFPEKNEIKSFYQCQFYYLQNNGSHQMMGWICFLEGIAMKFGKIATQRALVHGPKSVRFLKLHGEEDIDHINSAFKVLESFSDQQMMDVCINFQESADRYLSALEWAAASPDLHIRAA